MARDPSGIPLDEGTPGSIHKGLLAAFGEELRRNYRHVIEEPLPSEFQVLAETFQGTRGSDTPRSAPAS